MKLSQASILAIALAAASCSAEEFTPSTEAEIKARFADPVLTYSQWGFINNGKRYFPFIGDEGSMIGRGCTVGSGPKRSDGSRSAPAEGRWIYHYGGHNNLGPRLALGERENNRFVGFWRFWHKNGVVRAEGWFAASQMHGIWRIWNDDGSLDTGLSGVYSDGEREGDLPASSK